MPDAPVTRMVEDYVTLIWKAYEWPGSEPSTTDLAASLGVTPSTVSANLKRLGRDGFIAYEPYGAIALTPLGRGIAVGVVRRHRIIETYLVERLGLSWDEVHDEADRLEHAVSDLMLKRMDAELGHPRADPHGDPIPSIDGEIDSPDALRLLDAAPGDRVRVLRVSDRQPDVLRYLSAKGIGIGAELTLVDASRATGIVRLERAAEADSSGGGPLEPLEIGTAAAREIRVERA